MRCCPNCFNDEYAADYVGSLCTDRGKCDFCGALDMPLCSVEPEGELSSVFMNLLSPFAPIERARDNCLPNVKGSLAGVIEQTWDLFSFSDPSVTLRFLSQMFEGESWFEQLRYGDIVISPEHGNGRLSEYSFFGKGSWETFSESITNLLRFHSKPEHEEIFLAYVESLKTTIDIGSSFYRARLWNDSFGFLSDEDLMEPPLRLSSEGRMSAKGVTCLYLASSPETAAAEIRAGLYDKIALGELRTKTTLSVVDFRVADIISPFLMDIDCNVLAVNRDNIARLIKELEKPVRSSDSTLEYLPIQYFSDCIRASGKDGVLYPSVMNPSGYNLAVFHPAKESFSITDRSIMRVESIKYELGERAD